MTKTYNKYKDKVKCLKCKHFKAKVYTPKELRKCSSDTLRAIGNKKKVAQAELEGMKLLVVKCDKNVLNRRFVYAADKLTDDILEKICSYLVKHNKKLQECSKYE